MYVYLVTFSYIKAYKVTIYIYNDIMLLNFVKLSRSVV